MYERNEHLRSIYYILHYQLHVWKGFVRLWLFRYFLHPMLVRRPSGCLSAPNGQCFCIELMFFQPKAKPWDFCVSHKCSHGAEDTMA